MNIKNFDTKGGKVNLVETNEMLVNRDIKAYLENNGISQAFVSRKTGIEAPKLNMSLNGTRKLSLDEYARICASLGVNTDTFLKPRPHTDPKLNEHERQG